MSQTESAEGIVTQTIRDLLPVVNEGFDSAVLVERYDEDPAGTAMSVHFTDKSGENEVEVITLGVTDALELEVLPRLTDEWEYIGAIVMYQDHGLRILDPDSKMTPDRARYQYGGVTIRPSEGNSRERTWLVVSNVLDIILESVVYKRKQQQQAGGDGEQGPRDSREHGGRDDGN